MIHPVKQLRILLRDHDERLWSDEELASMLDHGLVWWNLTHPTTNNPIETYGPQNTAVLWASAVLALTHLLWHRSKNEDVLLTRRERDRYEELLESAERIFEESKLSKPHLFRKPPPVIWH